MILNSGAGQLMLWLLIVPLVLIFGLIIYAVIVRIIKHSKYYKKAPQSDEYDQEQLDLFLDAYGGKENILDIKKDMNRISLTVQDFTKVKPENLKSLGAKGVLLQGTIIKCSYAEKSEEVYSLLKRGMAND